MSHVGGATCRMPPIPRSALEKDPIKVGASYTDLLLPSPHYTHQKEGGEGFILPRRHRLPWPCVSGDQVLPHFCSHPSQGSTYPPTLHSRPPG